MRRLISRFIIVMACRQCYQDLADEIKNKPADEYSLIAITGAPGIGKSTFLVVLAQVRGVSVSPICC